MANGKTTPTATPTSGTVNVDDMIDHPELYGFQWGYGPLMKDKVELTKRAPFIEHVNADLIRKTFGDGYILNSLNGQSARVRDQTLREALYGDLKLRSDDRAMKVWVLNKALGNRGARSRTVVIEKIVEKRIYLATDGTEHDDKAELMAYEIDLRQAAQVDE